MVFTLKFALLASYIAAVSSAATAPRASVLKVPITKKIAPVDAKDLITRENARRTSFASAVAATANVPITNIDVSYIAATYDVLLAPGSTLC